MDLSKTNKILVVDDEDSLRFFLSEELESEGYKVYTAASGPEAMEFLKNQPVDLAIIDFQMPGLTGIELMEQMQSLDDVPELIMLTAHATLETSIEALRLGSCDFLLKPYDVEELLRGVKTAMSRRQQKNQQKMAAQLLSASLGLTPAEGTTPAAKMPPAHHINVRDLTIDTEAMTANKGDEEIMLTPTEFRLLVVMMKRPDHPFTFQELAEIIHGQQVDIFQARDLLKSHLGRLRQKIGPSYIVNVRGVGYKFASE